MTLPADEPQKSSVPEKKRHPAVAFVLSLIMPGLGQVYDGELRRGLVLFVVLWLFIGLAVFSGALSGFRGLVAYSALGTVLWVGIAIDAAVIARRIGSIQLKPYTRWFVYLAVAMVWSFTVDSEIFVSLQHEVAGLRTFRTPAAGMEPALHTGDHFVANLKSYRDKLPQRGDIVVFFYPEDRSKVFVKRVVGLEGETIEIRDKTILIDGKPIDDPWAVHRDPTVLPSKMSPRDNMGPVTIPKGKRFVLGDNRDFSHDSRFWGFLGKEDLHGKALYIYWSRDLNRIGEQLN